MILKKVRLSFPSLWEKTAYGDEEKKFEATFIFKAGDANHRLVLNELDLLKDENDDLNGKLDIEAQCKFLKDGEDKEYDGYGEGTFSVYAKNSREFPIVDADPTKVIKEVSEDNSPCKIYAGCYVNARIGLYVWKYKKKVGVGASLNGVQFAGHGEPFAKKVKKDEPFETVIIDDDILIEETDEF
jgi:hypothetical protein